MLRSTPSGEQRLAPSHLIQQVLNFNEIVSRFCYPYVSYDKVEFKKFMRTKERRRQRNLFTKLAFYLCFKFPYSQNHQGFENEETLT